MLVLHMMDKETEFYSCNMFQNEKKRILIKDSFTENHISCEIEFVGFNKSTFLIKNRLTK